MCSGGQAINHISADMCVAMSRDAAFLQLLHLLMPLFILRDRVLYCFCRCSESARPEAIRPCVFLCKRDCVVTPFSEWTACPSTCLPGNSHLTIFGKSEKPWSQKTDFLITTMMKYKTDTSMSQSVPLSGQHHSWGSAGCGILTDVTQTYGRNPKAEWAKELVRREQEQPESEDGFKVQGGENLLRQLCIQAQMGSLSTFTCERKLCELCVFWELQ